MRKFVEDMVEDIVEEISVAEAATKATVTHTWHACLGGIWHTWHVFVKGVPPQRGGVGPSEGRRLFRKGGVDGGWVVRGGWVMRGGWVAGWLGGWVS